MNTVEHNLRELADSIRRYTKVNKKMTEGEAVAKQIGKLGFALSRELRGIAPAKGSIRGTNLAALRSGRGLMVRASVKNAVLQKYGGRLNARTRIKGKCRGQLLNANLMRKGKAINLQALMVEREMSVRESGRGFLSVSSRYPNVNHVSSGLRSATRSKSRYGKYLSEAGITYEQQDTVLRFRWSPSISPESESAAEGLSTPKGQQSIVRAIQATRADIEAYIARKQNEAIQQALRV